MPAPSTVTADPPSTVYVYEPAVRLWHWINALAIVVLAVTGYLIASPLPTLPGEASDHFLMGYIRFAHFTAAYVLIIGFLFRLYWAFVGNRHARQMFVPSLHSPKWWSGVLWEAKWYSFIVPHPKKYIGHNPLATLAMHFMYVWGIVFMMVTGLALYGEGEGAASWQNRFFTSWVMPLFGNSQNVHTYHHLVMWLLVVFIIMHVYAALREDSLSRQTMLSAILSGHRSFRDDGPIEDHH